MLELMAHGSVTNLGTQDKAEMHKVQQGFEAFQDTAHAAQTGTIPHPGSITQAYYTQEPVVHSGPAWHNSNASQQPHNAFDRHHDGENHWRLGLPKKGIPLNLHYRESVNQIPSLAHDKDSGVNIHLVQLVYGGEEAVEKAALPDSQPFLHCQRRFGAHIIFRAAVEEVWNSDWRKIWEGKGAFSLAKVWYVPLARSTSESHDVAPVWMIRHRAMSHCAVRMVQTQRHLVLASQSGQ
jgi:hypothetical protein